MKLQRRRGFFPGYKDFLNLFIERSLVTDFELDLSECGCGLRGNQWSLAGFVGELLALWHD